VRRERGGEEGEDEGGEGEREGRRRKGNGWTKAVEGF
jgi:hypothetical protein